MILIDLYKVVRDFEGPGAPMGNDNASKDRINVSVGSAGGTAYAAEKLGIKNANFSKMDDETTNTILSATEEAMNDFPRLNADNGNYKKSINNITTTNKLKGESLAAYAWSSKGTQNAMYVNEKNTPESMNAFFKDNEETGFGVTKDLKGVVDHELGHSIDRAYNVTSLNNKEFSTIHSSYMDEKNSLAGGKGDFLGFDKKNLSTYGAYNRKEFFAEAYSEYKNSPTPRKYAMQVGEMMNKYKGKK